MTIAKTTTTALTAEPLRGLPSAEQWQTIREMGAALVSSGLVPVKTPEAASAIILKGAELGAPPMHSFAHISVIQGKPTCSAEMQLALLARGGVTWSWLKDGREDEAEIELRRPGFGPVRGFFCVADAQKAGLIGKDNWKKWLRSMLRARAVSDGARQIAPDLLAGMSYTPEELGATVNEDGAAVSTTYTVEDVAEAVDGEVSYEPAAAVQPDDEANEVARLWERVAELKATMPESVVKQELQPFGVVLGETKRSEVTPDTLRGIVDALEAEASSRIGEVVEEIRALEEAVHNAPTHTSNARKKHVGSDDIEQWDDIEALIAYRAHLSEQADAQASEAAA